MKTIIKFSSIESFETARLLAKKLQANDLEKLVIMQSNPEVMATLGGLRSTTQTQQDLEKSLAHWQKHGFGVWLFYLKETQAWVGRGSLRQLILDDKTEVEIGYALLPAFWNQGLATEITRACIEIAFEVLRLKNIICFTLTTNLPSQRVMQKAGFQYERSFIYHYEGVDYPHVLYRIQNYRTVEVVPHDTHWKSLFFEEALQIQNSLGSSLKAIHHIGSTAIPDMPAKPVIDMVLECDDIEAIEAIKQKLGLLGYIYFSRQIIPYRSYFSRRHGIVPDMSYHLHIYERGDPQIKRHIYFRDYLINHSTDAQRYASLKLQLAEKFKDDIKSYVMGKDQLVQEIDAKTKRWDGRNKQFLPPNLAKKQLSDDQLMKAIIANHNVYMTYYAQYLKQVELVRIPGYTLVNTHLADDTFNVVIDIDFSNSEATQKIDEITEYFTKEHVPFSWWLNPYDRPENLIALLESKQYRHTNNNTVMYLKLDAWKPHNLSSELDIVQATDKKTLQDFASVSVNDMYAFQTYFSWLADIITDDDPIEFYVGYHHGKPVVRCIVCYYAGMAGLYFLSTAAEERRKGYAAALLQFHLQQAKTLGYQIAVLESSLEGLPLYEKFGYQACGVFKEFKLI